LVGWTAEGYIFGAVCPARGTGAALVLPYADKHAMTLHLAEISQAVAPGAHAVVIVDGAGWHKPGGRLKLPENISTLVLPSYSPELNPQENVWQYLRQNYLSNRVFKTYTAIVDACCDAWNALVRQPDQITSISSREWAKKVTTWCRWHKLAVTTNELTRSDFCGDVVLRTMSL